MARYLIVTPVDILRQPNNREHHLVRHIAPRFAEAWIVFRRLNNDAKSSVFRQMLTSSSTIHRHDDGVSCLEVDPFFNSRPNMAMDITGSYDAEDNKNKCGDSKQRLYILLNGLGLVKDIFFIFSMFAYTLLRTPGRFDVGVGMGPYGNAVIRLLQLTGKVRCRVYEDRDYEAGFFHNPIRRTFVEWLERSGVRSANLVLSIGHRLAALREKQTGQPVPVITTGVDYLNFIPHSGVARKPAHLVYVGNITFWSGLDTIIEGFALARKTLPAIRLTIVGDGLPGYLKQLTRQVEMLGLVEAVHFKGRVANTEIPSILATADLGVAVFRPIDLRAYAFPLKLLEYMAAGLPVIGNRDMETEDVITRYQCGRSVDFTVSDIADSICEILDDPELFRKMSVNSRNASMQHDWTSLMEKEYQLLHAGCLASASGDG